MRTYPRLSSDQRKELQDTVRANNKPAGEVKRAQVILLLNKGSKTEDISSITGFGRSQIFEIRKQYATQGICALRDKRKGKPKELLTRKQRDEIVQTLKTNRPSELGTYYRNYDYWNTGVLGAYIQRTYDVEYKSKTSHYLLFKQAKFTYHKPGRVYHERDENEVEQWETSTKPRLQQLWQEPNTVILSEDEMILTTQTTIQKIWLPQGEYPKIEVSNQSRQRRNLYGFLNIKTGVQHAFKTLKQNMRVTREILEKVRTIYPTQKIALLWDSAGWHRGSSVKEFIEQDGAIEIIHFPRYAPEENPQEHIWKEGRSHVSHNRFMEDIDEATDEFIHYLNTTTFPYSLLGFSPTS